MTLIPNARRIAARAHSMWAFYLGLLLIWLPEIIYALTGADTSPRLWFVAGTAAILYGILGRLLDQGIDRDRTRSPAIIAILGIVIVGALVWQDVSTPAPEPRDVPVAAEPEAEATGVTEAAFLAVARPLVAKWEGLRLEAYADPVGVWTICYGSTRGVRPGDRLTEAECDAMLEAELLEYRNGLHRYFNPDTIADRLTPHRDAAYGSLAYNVGIAGAGGSTATRRLNAGDIAGGCEALTWWNKAGGRVMRGLVRRRAEEYELCMRGLGDRA